MVQLSPQVIIGQSCIASCVVVPLIDNVLTLFRIGQYTRTGASRTKDGGIGKTGYASTLLALQKKIFIKFSILDCLQWFYKLKVFF